MNKIHQIYFFKEEKMKKILLALIAFAVIFAGCGDNITNSEISFTINNMSSYDLLSVEYASVSFGNINSGRDVTKNVSKGTRYIFFNLLINNEQIRCRTAVSYTCEEGKENEFTFTSSTSVTTIVGEITDTLKNIVDTMTIESNKPQIVIKQGNTIIVQHGDFNFGTVLLNTTKEFTFTIENTGKTNLTIEIINDNRINMTDNTSGYFNVLLQPLSPTVAPGSSATFNIRFSPTVKGNNYAASLQIKTNSRNNDEFIFRVIGNCSNEYQIGDTGPGGGMVFFAQGGQYKECSAELGSYNWATAKTTASSYKGGSFSDWYLPDRGELDLMYENLHKKSLGGFSNALYWSSTAAISSGYAWAINFSNGLWPNQSFNYSGYYTSSSLRVRAVRAFSLTLN